MNKSIIWSVIVILILAGAGYWLYQNNQNKLNSPVVTNFTECVDSGYEVSDTTPRECKSPSGEVFVEDSSTANTSNPKNVGTGGCYIGGCSSQICSDQKDAVSTCEFREEYACYNNAKCERQASGQCGWTQTPELKICLSAVVSPDVPLK